MLTKGKLPASAWIDVVSTAHELGIRSSATMMYGHVDHPRHWLGHFRVLADIQDRTGGFTEFVALPFIHTNAPIYLAGIARAGATWRENRAVHAMARILLHGRIPNIQCSWVKLGDDGTVAMLQGGAQRPRRHADGGDDLADGRFRVRLRPYGRGVAAPWQLRSAGPARQRIDHLYPIDGRNTVAESARSRDRFGDFEPQ